VVEGKQESLKRSLELLWGEPERPSRGPKPALSVDRIVAAAVDIADREGLAAVSMQRVAAEFGFTTMSLYRYVPGKTELVNLMIDMSVGDPPDLAALPGWRAQLEAWAQATLAHFRRHPWFLNAAVEGVFGPRQVRWLEVAVAALAATGLTGADLIDAVMAVNGLVRATGQVPGPEDPGNTEWAAFFGAALASDPDRYPALTRAAADGAFAPSTGDLAIGLHLVLDGIDALIARRTTP
jgi:AcrR family transcriptional regulator